MVSTPYIIWRTHSSFRLEHTRNRVRKHATYIRNHTLQYINAITLFLLHVLGECKFPARFSPLPTLIYSGCMRACAPDKPSPLTKRSGACLQNNRHRTIIIYLISIQPTNALFGFEWWYCLRSVSGYFWTYFHYHQYDNIIRIVTIIS